jgi:uncharacterized membrane protein YhhN
MLIALLPIPFAIVSLFMLLRAETAVVRDVRQVRIWKPATTALIIASALLAFSGRNLPTYTLLIAVALVLCFFGDVFLIDGDKPASFARGLSSFLFAHLVLIGAFTYAQGVRFTPFNLERELAVAAVLVVLIGLFYVYLGPSLGAFRQPVLVYVVVIGLMVHRAVTGFDVSRGFITQSTLAAGGAIFFLVSDLILALNKFMFPPSAPGPGPEAIPGMPTPPVKTSARDRSDSIWILSLYYTGITLLALSASFVV